ncbi:uncharacterized protein UTRI_10262 [Ustilago trichophora]|uniref:Uncharacterized protein n=1 Tax=Ustilago trichophora TaxID=86804 RepID=A0A5C3EPZ1_9BASI|nr:uncharacterized protein UTRI_10262 [Ustilago trichophora]
MVTCRAVLVLAGFVLSAVEIHSLPAGGPPSTSSPSFQLWTPTTDGDPPSLRSPSFRFWAPATDGEHGTVRGDFHGEPFTPGESIYRHQIDPNALATHADQGGWTYSLPPPGPGFDHLQKGKDTVHIPQFQSSPVLEPSAQSSRFMPEYGLHPAGDSFAQASFEPDYAHWESRPTFSHLEGMHQYAHPSDIAQPASSYNQWHESERNLPYMLPEQQAAASAHWHNAQQDPLYTHAGHFDQRTDAWSHLQEAQGDTIAQQHAISEEELHNAITDLLRDESLWTVSNTMGPLPSSPHWTTPVFPEAQDSAYAPLRQHSEHSVNPHLHAAEALGLPIQGSGPAVAFTEASHHPNKETTIAVDKHFGPPAKRTPLQESIENFSILFGSGFVKGRDQGMAYFPAAAAQHSWVKAKVPFANKQDLAHRLSVQSLSRHQLAAGPKSWEEMGLRMLFAQDNNNAYGIVDAELLKGFFPGLSEQDKLLLKDGSVALIEVQRKAEHANNYIYRLYGIFDTSRFESLKHL